MGRQTCFGYPWTELLPMVGFDNELYLTILSEKLSVIPS